MAFKAKHKIEHIEAPADVVPFEEGGEPLRVSVRTSLSHPDVLNLEAVKDPITWGELKAIYAPFIVGWNVDAPPPAEGGPEQFNVLPPDAWQWLLVEASKPIYSALLEIIATYGTAPVSDPSADGTRRLDA